MVPDLRDSDESRDAAYWREHITDGIEGTLMPAFAKEKQGGVDHKSGRAWFASNPWSAFF